MLCSLYRKLFFITSFLKVFAWNQCSCQKQTVWKNSFQTSEHNMKFFHLAKMWIMLHQSLSIYQVEMDMNTLMIGVQQMKYDIIWTKMQCLFRELKVYAVPHPYRMYLAWDCHGKIEKHSCQSVQLLHIFPHRKHESNHNLNHLTTHGMK